LEPLNEGYWLSMTPLLWTSGRLEEAYEIRERGRRIWPNSPVGWYNRFFGGAFVMDPRESLAMLDSPAGRERIQPDVAVVFRDFMRARQSGDAAGLRRAALAALELRRRLGSEGVAAALVVAGELDQGHRILDEYLQGPGVTTWALFNPAVEPLRRDPRFMTLAQRAGLIPYWRETGRWPDFCGQRDLPYNCEQEAARVLPEP
jgi:hypothetical protein